MRKFHAALLIWALFIIIISPGYASSKQDTTLHEVKQYPGLGKAASGIFYSEKPYSITGFGEFGSVNYMNNSGNSDLNDLELYYNNLYRLTVFFGYRFSDKVILNSEIMMEYLTAPGEDQTDFIPELFLDFRLSSYFNLRTGIHPIGHGYINRNDEPILYYSVNRPEVERLIVPTTWMGMGVMAYGDINEDWSYFFSVVSGPEVHNLSSATWIRGGSHPNFQMNSIAIAPQLLYRGINNLELGVAAYIGNMAYDKQPANVDLKTPRLDLFSFHGQYRHKQLRVTAMATTGALSNTQSIYDYTLATEGAGQVLGNKVYGYYVEVGYDVLKALWPNRNKPNKKLLNANEMILPIFLRYERLDTHAGIETSLKDYNYSRQNLDVLTVGLNYNLNEDIVIKANYQFRNNNNKAANQVEFGIGFNF